LAPFDLLKYVNTPVFWIQLQKHPLLKKNCLRDILYLDLLETRVLDPIIHSLFFYSEQKLIFCLFVFKDEKAWRRPRSLGLILYNEIRAMTLAITYLRFHSLDEEIGDLIHLSGSTRSNVGCNSVLGLASLATVALFVHSSRLSFLSYQCFTSTTTHTAQTTE
jgi:hypothetical protein